MTTDDTTPRLRAPLGPAEPICWPVYDDQDHEQIMLAEVGEWVDWIRWRYTLDHRTIPTCWPQHGALIEELSALYTAWQTAYTNPDGTAPLLWMNHFHAARERLTQWVARTGCRPSEHRVQ
ncbi:hypothetical protein [Cellulomonas fimi]|uniref:DUF4913 domain-containing protein n=1 Tax=Cellulomonas fimi TaxID=1708 RepID=A0A7Y0LWM5_CELFI|nr:hypothetical protein [Cellulomonas fimi]NMR19189.1 hypothetical protein [Cellulomonas fimi]